MRVLLPPVCRSGLLTSYWKCEVSKRASLNYLATRVHPEGCIQSGGGLLHQTCAKLLYGILQIPTRRPCGRDGFLVVAAFVVCSVQISNRYSIINPVQRLTGTLTLRNKDTPPLSTCSRRTMPRPMHMAKTSLSKSHKWLSRPQCNDVRDLTSHGALSLSVSISRALSLFLSLSLTCLAATGLISRRGSMLAFHKQHKQHHSLTHQCSTATTRCPHRNSAASCRASVTTISVCGVMKPVTTQLHTCNPFMRTATFWTASTTPLYTACLQHTALIDCQSTQSTKDGNFQNVHMEHQGDVPILLTTHDLRLDCHVHVTGTMEAAHARQLRYKSRLNWCKQRDSIMIRSALGGVRKYVALGTRFYVAAMSVAYRCLGRISRLSPSSVSFGGAGLPLKAVCCIWSGCCGSEPSSTTGDMSLTQPMCGFGCPVVQMLSPSSANRMPRSFE